MNAAATDGISTERAARLGLTLIGIRLGAVMVVTVLVWLGVRAGFGIDSFPPNTMWATLALFPVNVLCLWLARKHYRAEGKTLWQAMGVRRGRLGADVLNGLLLLFALGVPFVLAVLGVGAVLYGADVFTQFETIFFSMDSVTPIAPASLLVLALVSAVPFMLINAPAEELVFRGHALDGATARWGPVIGIGFTSVLFGVQHIVFAASVPGALVYFVAFTVWGAAAAIAVRRQGRLFPVVIAHWMVNIAFAAPGIVLPILMLAGVVQQ